MEITTVNIALAETCGTDRLKAFATLVFDECFAVHGLRIIAGNHAMFVAMPPRKLMDKCQTCGQRNYLLAKWCNQCGTKLTPLPAWEEAGPGTLHEDVCHPINTAMRTKIQAAVLVAYHKEVARELEVLHESA